MLLQNETVAYIIILYKTVKLALHIYLFTFILKWRKYTEENNEISCFIPHRIFTDFHHTLFEKEKKKYNTSTIFHFATMKNATTLKKYNIC